MKKELQQKAPVAQYRELKFKNDDAFNAWLNTKAKQLIWLVDTGQDLTCMWIDEHGEVLHSNLQTAIWCGMFVNLYSLIPGENLEMYFEHTGWRTMMKLTCETIERL